MRSTALKFAVLLCFLFSFKYSGGQQIFQKGYYIDTLLSCKGNSFLKLADGGYMALGETNLPGNNEVLYLMRLDSIGNVQWSKTYQTIGSALNSLNIIAVEDSNFILCGTHILPATIQNYVAFFQIKINLSGDVLWSKTFQDTSFIRIMFIEKSIFFNNALYSVGGYKKYIGAAGGWNTDSTLRGVFIKSDTAGQILWARDYDGISNVQMQINDFVPTPDSGFVMVGYTLDLDSIINESKIIYFKVDSFGNILWSFSCDSLNANPKAIIDAGDGYVIGGVKYGFVNSDAFLFKTDYSGNIIWSRQYGNGGTGDDDLRSILKLQDGNFIYHRGGHYFIIIDSLGNNSMGQGISNYSQGNLFQICLEKNNGLCGIGYEKPAGGSVYFFKTDSTYYSCINYTGPFPNYITNLSSAAYSLSDSSISLPFVTASINDSIVTSNDTVYCFTSTGSKTMPQPYSLYVYPNPFNDYLNVASEELLNDDIVVQIIDVTGRVVFNKQLYYHNKVSLNTRSLRNGIYFLKFITKRFAYSKLIIKN